MNKKEKTDLVSSVLQHKNIMLLLVGMLMLTGVASLITMPKNEFPEFTFPIGVVAGVYPGATAEEVETQLTTPLENFIFSFPEVDKTRTYTQTYDGMVVAFVRLNDNVKDATTFWNKMKERIAYFKLSLPRGVLGIVANDDFGDSAALLVSLESNDKTCRELHEYMEELKDSPRSTPDLANLLVFGEQHEQTGIYVNRDQMTKYGVNALTLYNSLSSQGNTMVSGQLEKEHRGPGTLPAHCQGRLAAHRCRGRKRRIFPCGQYKQQPTDGLRHPAHSHQFPLEQQPPAEVEDLRRGAGQGPARGQAPDDGAPDAGGLRQALQCIRRDSAAQKSIEKAKENLRMNEDYYAVGTANMTSLLDAQRLKQQALDQYNDAVCEYQLCRSHYLTVTARSGQVHP